MPKQSRYPHLPMPATHAQIVAHYTKYRRPDFADELGWFAEPKSFSSALVRAVKAENRCGKRLSHQWRLGQLVIPTAQALLRIEQAKLGKVKTFDALFGTIQTTMEKVPGAGALYAYDTALRLGAHMKLAPAQVFLQAGTLEGARKLLPKVRGRSVELQLFPKAFHHLAPAEMEHLLCSYRRWL